MEMAVFERRHPDGFRVFNEPFRWKAPHCVQDELLRLSRFRDQISVSLQLRELRKHRLHVVQKPLSALLDFLLHLEGHDLLSFELLKLSLHALLHGFGHRVHRVADTLGLRQVRYELQFPGVCQLLGERLSILTVLRSSLPLPLIPLPRNGLTESLQLGLVLGNLPLVLSVLPLNLRHAPNLSLVGLLCVSLVTVQTTIEQEPARLRS